MTRHVAYEYVMTHDALNKVNIGVERAVSMCHLTHAQSVCIVYLLEIYTYYV